MDIRKIRKLIELVEETSISELRVKEGEEIVHIKGQVHVNSLPQAYSVSPHEYTAPPVVATQEEKSAVTKAETSEGKGHIIKAPIVGTFYRASSPGAEPFVKEGQHVNKGDIVCIIEAMKMMNHIEADKAGTLVEFFVEDGQPLEYDQPLLNIV